MADSEQTPSTPPTPDTATAPAREDADGVLNDDELESVAGGDVIDWVIQKMNDWYDAQK